MAAKVTLKSRFPQIERSMQLGVSAVLKAGAERVADQAKINLNSITGETAESIEVTGGAGEFKVEATARDPKGRPYPHWIEFGRKNAPARPFLMPALEAETERIENDVQTVLRAL